MLQNNESFWAEWLTSTLHFPVEEILKGNINKKDMKTCLGTYIHFFWYEMFQYLSEINLSHGTLAFEYFVYEPV